MNPQVWGQDYNVGYVGFTFGRRNFLSNAIAYFELPECRSGLHVSHTLLVAGDNDCIEAQPSGVVHSDIESYWTDPDSVIYWRRPRGWTPEFGQKVVNAAEAMVGDGYGFTVILGHWLARNPAGTILGAITGGLSTRLLLRFLDRKGEEVCSEVVAAALRSIHGFEHRGCLARPPWEITPQRLFEDSEIWDPPFTNLSPP